MRSLAGSSLVRLVVLTRAAILVTVAGVLPGCESDSPTAPSEMVSFSTTDLRVGTGTEAMTRQILRVANVIWLYDSAQPDNKGQQVADSVGLFIQGAGQVIQGIDQGVVGMRVGGLRRLTVPPELALGAGGSGSIPANAALVIEVELLEVQPLATDSAPFSITDLRVGDGAEAADGNTVTVAYGAWLYDESEPDNKGVQVDLSDRFSFVLGANQVIFGWDAGIVGMRVSGERRLVVPPERAYGQAGNPPLIPPDATLVFDITLLGVL